MLSVLIADQNIQFIDKARKILPPEEYRIVQALDDSEAKLRLETENIDLCLINADLPKAGGISLLKLIREQMELKLPIAWMISQGRDILPDDFLELAEGVLIRPIRPQELWSCIFHLKVVKRLFDGGLSPAQSAQRDSSKSREAQSEPNPETPLYPLAWFRKIAALEVKRAIRFQTPLSLIIISYDLLPEQRQMMSEQEQHLLANALAEAVGRTVRDIDIPVQFSPEHVLVLMPNTDVEEVIAEASRLKGEIQRILKEEFFPNQLVPTISLGATTSSSKEPFKFTDLLRGASRALKEARIQGGDSVFFC